MSSKKINSTFKDYLLLSLTLHFALFIFLFIWSFIFHSDTKAPKTQVTWLKLGNSFTEKQSGDPSLGPDFKRIENTKVNSEASEKTEVKNEKKIKLPKNENLVEKTNSAKDLSFNNKNTKTQKNPPSTPKENTQTLQKANSTNTSKTSHDEDILKALSKINQKGSGEGGESSHKIQGSSEGNSIQGGTNTECSSYKNLVKRRIQTNWTKLKINNSGTARAPQVFVRINASGAVVSIQWQQKSGDFVTDQAAQRAIQNSNPFPAPPVQCTMALSEGITIRFQ